MVIMMTDINITLVDKSDVKRIQVNVHGELKYFIARETDLDKTNSCPACDLFGTDACYDVPCFREQHDGVAIHYKAE